MSIMGINNKSIVIMYKNFLLYNNSRAMNFMFLIAFFVLLLGVLIHKKFIVSHDNIIEFTQVVSASNEGEWLDTKETVAEESKLANGEYIISEGDTLGSILSSIEVSKSDSLKIISAVTKVFNLRKLTVGNVIKFEEDTSSSSESFIPKLITIRVSTTKKLEVARDAKGNYKAAITELPLVKYFVRKSATIDSSFMSVANKLAIPGHIVMKMIKSFNYDIDFQNDLKYGDKLDVIMDTYYTEDGKFSHVGGAMYAAITMGNKVVEIYRFSTKDDDEVYLNSNGQMVKKELLRTPLNALRLTSGFGMRMHPVHGFSRMHKGVDYGAPTGTPILAAGAGVVEEIGRKGGYGKYIRIKHNSTYATAYAHISNFAKGLRSGTKVKQGQVIAYVGATGTATAPHLHYEILKYGKQINPQNVKIAPSSGKLVGKEKAAFDNQKSKVKNLLKILENNKQVKA